MNYETDIEELFKNAKKQGRIEGILIGLGICLLVLILILIFQL